MALLSLGATQKQAVTAPRSKISESAFSSSCSQIGFGNLLEPEIHSHCLKRQQSPRKVHRIFRSLPSDWTLSRKWMVIRRGHEFRSNTNGFQTWKIVTCFWIVLDGQTIIAEWFVDASWTFNVGLCLRTQNACDASGRFPNLIKCVYPTVAILKPLNKINEHHMTIWGLQCGSPGVKDAGPCPRDKQIGVTHHSGLSKEYVYQSVVSFMGK